MTEQEWLQATDPGPMLEFLRGKTSERKLRLFTVACCRRIWPLMSVIGRKAVEANEKFADGKMSKKKRLKIYFAVFEDCRWPWIGADNADPKRNASAAAFRAIGEDANTIASDETLSSVWFSSAMALALDRFPLDGDDDRLERQMEEEKAVQCHLLRDIIGNRFRPVSVGPAWLSWHDGLLVSMAQQMYDSRDFTDMPILADALEEAGCTEPDILRHCREGGDHFRGCWVVDLLLGKE
jgi:hypothetical protein